MNPLDLKQAQDEPAAENEEYESYRDSDPAVVEFKIRYESEVEAKVASDYSHIVWAYGVIWALFAVYAMFLWRRSRVLSADVDALRAKMTAKN